MGKQVVGFAITDIGYTITDVTFGHCNRIDTGAAIDTTGSTLTHQSNGLYVLYVPNITHTTGPATFFISVTADPSKYVEGIINPILGDEARHSTVFQTSDTRLPETGVLATVNDVNATAHIISHAPVVHADSKVTVGDVTGAFSEDDIAKVLIHDADFLNIGETATTPGIDCQFRFEPGITHPLLEVHLHGYYRGGGTHYVDVYAWNYTAEEWELLHISGQGLITRTTEFLYTFNLTQDHLDSVNGVTLIRFLHPIAGVGSHQGLFINHITVHTVDAQPVLTVQNMLDGGIAAQSTLDALLGGTMTRPYVALQKRIAVKGSRVRYPQGDEILMTIHVDDSWTLTGKNVYLCIKRYITDDNADAVINRACVVTAAQTCTITPTALETTIEDGEYIAEVEVREAGDTAPQTALQFVFEILPTVRTGDGT